MFKVNSFITVPDSVKASHILLIPDTTSTYEGMYALLDSLKTAVENGADFAELAKEYSDGPSNVEGGDLGWFKQGAMVQQFNDACFYGNEGDMPIVGTQFGLHLINIEKQSAGTEMAELAIVKKHIDASSNTEQKTYANVSLFASENNTEAAFDKAVVDQRLVKRIASNVIESDREIRGLKDSRELIKWAYGKDIEPGTISNVFEIRSENCYVVAKLSQIREEGTAAFEQVKDQIEPIVIRKKKAEMIEAKIKEAMNANKDLRALANNLNTQVDTAKNIAFNSFSVPKLGIEPKLISSVANTDVNAGVSAPVEGNNAVYVFTVVNKTEAAEVDNYDQQKAQLTSTMRSRVNYEMVEAMQKATEIEDNRSRFF
jgi:peptidyl-prolyl cis-trans isomerase D